MKVNYRLALSFIAGRSALCVACLYLLAAIVLPISAFAQQPPMKRVYIVQSYEKGHVCGEPQAEGILEALAAGEWVVGRNLTVRSYYMDTYRTNATPEAMQAQGQKALQEIAEFK